MMEIKQEQIFDENLELVTVQEGTDLQDAIGTPTMLKRIRAYNVSEQLNLLYDDIDQGLFGEQAKAGKFFQYIKEIKEKYPKDI